MSSKYLTLPSISQDTLHRTDLERDSCGVGVVADINGKASHRVLRLGLDSVCNVTHRGAVNSDGKTGDGAGVTTNLPYKLFLPFAQQVDADLKEEDQLAVGVFFLPKEHTKLSKKNYLSAG